MLFFLFQGEAGAHSVPRYYNEIERESRHLDNFPSEIQRKQNATDIDVRIHLNEIISIKIKLS